MAFVDVRSTEATTTVRIRTTTTVERFNRTIHSTTKLALEYDSSRVLGKLWIRTQKKDHYYLKENVEFLLSELSDFLKMKEMM
jgi:predicted DNA-binding protein